MKQEMPIVYDFVYSSESRWDGNQNIKYYQFDIVEIKGKKILYLAKTSSSKFRKNFSSIAGGEKWAANKIREHIIALAAAEAEAAKAMAGMVPVPADKTPPAP